MTVPRVAGDSPGRASPLSRPRRILGWVLAAGGVPLLTLALVQVRTSLELATALVLFMALAVTTAAVGGRRPALLAAAVGFVAANWYFTPPYHHWTVAEAEHVLALAVFLGVAGLVSYFVDTAARRRLDAARARAEAETLARLAATTAEDDPGPSLLGHLRDAFGLQAAAVLCRSGDGWSVEAASGEAAPTRPEEGDRVEPLAPDGVLAVAGGGFSVDDGPLLAAFAAQLGAARERRRLRAEARRAEQLAAANELRSAILQAVSHDLRTPLASIKASVSSLRQGDVNWSAAETREFLSTIADETDRLTTLVTNLLDMSRIQAGAVRPALQAIGLEEVVPAAVASLGQRGAVVDVDLDETLPAVRADAALLERALANLIDNAVRFTPPGQRVRVEADVRSERLDVRVVDRGRGIPRSERERAFQPFQRLGDRHAGGGVGLGLAVTRGFVNAMGGTIEIDDTPGAGTTIVVSLPVA